MKPTHWLLLTRLALCTILAASSALYLHYLDPADSGFCGLRSGCEAVRRSSLSHLGWRWLSLPLVSLVAYSALFALSLLASARSQPPGSPSGPRQQSSLGTFVRSKPYVALFVGCGIGAAIALGLIAVQALWIQQYCWLCLVVDVGAVLAAAFAFGLARSVARGERPREWLHPGASMAVALLFLAGPVGWTALAPATDVPASIRALYAPGKLNVVEFADFQCPYCRKLHHTLGPILATYGDQVHFQRLHRPLPQHPMAEAAARAAICAAEQGKGEEMAEQLFSMELSPTALTRAAERLGLDPGSYDACLEAASTDAVLNDHEALLPEGQLEGLPTTFVGHKKIIGVRSEAELRDEFQEAARGPGPSLPAPAYAGMWLFVVGLVCVAGMARAPR